MGENSLSSVEEVISIDDCAAGSSYSTIPFSKKAIHQRDADENLFLRFLELDPIPDPATSTGGTATTATATTTTFTNTIANSGVGAAAALLAEQRKKAYVRPSNGRTPFTITKKLVRENDNRGYGFSIVWTHPPRVEKVEPGLTAEKCGILPGDFVVFVDKHNVVTMPELDILNLIKSQGDTLLLEIYRRSSTKPSNGLKSRNSVTISSNQMMVEQATPKQSSIALEPRPSTACSNTTYSMETTKRRLHLPQVTFSKESIAPHSADDVPRRFLYQLINSEQHFVTAIQYGIQRFVAPLQERSDLISASDHRSLFQNLEEILRLSEDILEQLVTEDQDPQLNFASRVYVSKSTAICAAYKRYCNGLKRADCVLVNKSRNSNSDFVTFITIPQVPRKRPDLTSFIHRPLQHFREILKFNLMLASHCRPDTDEFRNFTTVVNAFQTAYRDITVSEGLMEPLGEGRPLLTLQDLEARLVFTKCKPFTLCVPGRQWVFGGDLSRVEGRSVKPYWTLLFSDIIVFAKVSRDRVLFITEEPLSLINIVDSCFNIRKKATEFRITVDPNGRLAESPTAHCAPDLSRTPRKNSRRRTIVLRAPSAELKAVWQNLLQRQIFQVNAALGSSLSSPIDSPDIMQTFIPLSDIGAATTSMASIKLSSDSVYLRNQQNKSTKVSKQVEEIIDEKCRILNKTGTARGSAIHHLSLWMKGQLDCAPPESESTNEPEPEEEPIEDWSRDQLMQRSKELQLIDENGKCKVPKLDGVRNCDRVEEITLSEVEDECKSASRSTTSDSQITVRSSPIANNDKISVCRHCHKNCKSKLSQSTSNSLKVQHSQASPNRCCQSPSSSSNSQTSISTLTGSANHSQLSNCDKNSRTSLLNRSDADKRSSTSSTNQPCNCKCDPEDFQNTMRCSQELRKETCKIINSVAELNFSPKSPSSVQPNHSNCKCSCDEEIEKRIAEGKFDKDADDWSLMLIGLAQIHPTTALVQVDPFEALPTISVVPPTPEGVYSKLSSSLLWDNSKLNQDDAKRSNDQNGFDDEVSPEDSPQDEEPPYRTLKTGLKRYGTMSSLEKVSSEDADDKTLNSSDEDYDCDDDIKIVTKEIFNTEGKSQNWTNRAGSFLEQSRAFFDTYLGRWDRNNGEDVNDETIDDCTSGATSGEEVWGTPTSGENDEIQMFNSDQTHSSPTKSSSSLIDDDTELMMDELLMAPPMTASSIRGLLPRRRLEPLFEEDTESGNSDEDNLPPDCSSSDQGQVRKTYIPNGHDLEKSRPIESTPTSPVPTTMQTVRPIAPYAQSCGSVADICSTPALPGEVKKSVENIDPVDGRSNAAVPATPAIAGLSPRLEMRLALNNDIMGDEDLICYAPGPDLATILGRDLSTYHRFTGRDLISRSASRIVPKEGRISFCQQKNSKMDTPTPNRKKSNQSTWNSSAFAGPANGKNLSDLERLARQEMKHCKYQLKSCPATTRSTNQTTNTTHADGSKSDRPKFFSFLSRKTSKNRVTATEFNLSVANNTTSPGSPSRSDADKSLDRRFWKQLSKRRRSLSVSEIEAM
ncbi:uncharacterized protein LOC119075772 isoform X1 [Bradysia coprophila]|uniref:uncharacterized protein LOC119075772 isoform X1 n=1 Tax=Bradysia coprophila TaxID=38358 RepID=UPI00187DBFD9|nr:uncharacterized protein LOC119075772 isoform X1 [Bradysia coprophila]XP_037038215.1 uncharacterized protein LOC119075772 isoform X1 [Bradysia coprophila]